MLSLISNEKWEYSSLSRIRRPFDFAIFFSFSPFSSILRHFFRPTLKHKSTGNNFLHLLHVSIFFLVHFSIFKAKNTTFKFLELDDLMVDIALIKYQMSRNQRWNFIPPLNYNPNNYPFLNNPCRAKGTSVKDSLIIKVLSLYAYALF